MERRRTAADHVPNASRPEPWRSQTDSCSTHLSRMPFIDSMELAGVLGEAHATVHRALSRPAAPTASSGG